MPLLPVLLASAAVVALAASPSSASSDIVACPATLFPKLSMGIGYDTQDSCQNVGGCWMEDACYAPDVSGYKLELDPASTDYNMKGTLRLNRPSGMFQSADFNSLDVSLVQESDSRMHLRFTPKSDDGSPIPMWEVPENLIPRPGGLYTDATDMRYHVESTPAFQLSIGRGKDMLLTLSKTLVYQEQYLQFIFDCPKNTRATFGFGESTRSQQSMHTGARYVLWNTDYWAAGFDESLYGSHPFYLQLRDDGTAHGVLIMNSNAMEVTMSRARDDSHPLLGVQTTGGIIDIYVFNGPTPNDVIQQLQQVIGLPAMAPYWALGLHNCRWGYPSLDYVKDVVANYSIAGIPLETQWVDIDYMQNYRDFTTDKVKFPANEMKEFVDKLHANNQHFVPIVDPGIYAIKSDGNDYYDALNKGLEMNVFLKDLNGIDNYLGQVWPGTTYFPDWFAANATDYWVDQLKSFHEVIPFDGIWIDMNEVSNFCNAHGTSQICRVDPDSTCPDGCCLDCQLVDPSNRYDFPPYTPHISQGSLSTKTVQMSTLHANGVREYYTHSLYGLMESMATRHAVMQSTGTRPFVLSRSTFLSSGSHAFHWTGDNAATWNDLKASIITMNNLALFGIPFTGADICGFAYDTNEELCARWIEVGSFSVFTRDHNELDAKPQELYRWKSVTNAAKNALKLKYELLPHLYTLLYLSSTTGSTVHNALWMHFSWDPLTTARDQQFMWSDSVLFTPVVEQNATSVMGYFPKGRWYPLTCTRINPIETNTGEFVSLDTPLEVTNAHVRGGRVVPLQGAAMTTAESRLTPYNIIVALDENRSANGQLFIDDGVSIDMTDYVFMAYESRNGYFTSKVAKVAGKAVTANKAEFPWKSTIIGTVQVLGWFSGVKEGSETDRAWSLPKAPEDLTKCTVRVSFPHSRVKRSDVELQAKYDFEGLKMTVDLKPLNIEVSEEFTMTWNC